MKKIILCLNFLLLIGYVQAQRTSVEDLLFPKYTEGIAILQDGTKVAGLYNYSTIQRQIQYLENNNVLTFKNPSEVISITIGDRVFENALNNRFLERIPIGDGFYYIDWGAKWISVGKSIGSSGARSHSHSTTSYRPSDTGTATSARYTQEEGMTTIHECFYYIKKGDNSFKRFSSAASLAKAIGCCKKELKQFVKTEKIDFKNPDDVQRMMMTFFNNYSTSSSSEK